MIYEHNPTKLFDSDSESCDTVSYSEECQAGEEEEEAEEEYDAYYDAEQYEEEDEEEDEEESDEGESLISNDMSAYSEMSIDMEVYNDVDVIAVAREVQVGGSGCGWYPMAHEDIEMEDVPYINVEMLDADEGVEMMLAEDEDLEMEEAVDMMDVDGEFW
ncbi:unnamed protein product [Mucor circinelloides]